MTTRSSGSRFSNVPRSHASSSGLSAFDGTFSGATIKLIAGESGAAGTVLYQDTDLLAYLASNDTAASSEIIGIATLGFAQGRPVNIQFSGPLTVQSWDWTVGARVYVGTDGGLTQTEPGTGYILVVGVAISSSTILIDVERNEAGASDAADVSYTPDVSGDWDVEPDDVAEALDYLAANAGGGDAAEITYTPDVSDDWDVVPDDVAEALDALAASGGGTTTTYAGGSKFLIEEITLTTAGEFDFDSIPQGYDRLIIEGYIRGSDASLNTVSRLYFNEDTTDANYRRQVVGAYDGADEQSEASNTFFGNVVGDSSQSGAHSAVTIGMEGYNTSIRKTAYCRVDGAHDTSALRTNNSIVSSGITDPITRVRLRPSNHPTTGFTGTVRLYGEKSITESDVVRQVTADGASAEIYELTLSTQQDNVTGDGSTYTIPFDTETTSRSWASVSAGEVTLEPGTYYISGGARLTGASSVEYSNGQIIVDGGRVAREGDYINGETGYSPRCAAMVTLSSSLVVSFRVQAGSGSKSMDAVDSASSYDETYLRITRLPVSTPMIVEGAAAEVYELTMTSLPTNVTGDDTVYVIPFDTETEARSWASNSGGTVTVQPGTYIVHGAGFFTGGTTFKYSVGRIILDGANHTYSRDDGAGVGTNQQGQAFAVITAAALSTIGFSVQVGGGSKVGDLASASLRITRLPVQAPFSDVQEDSTTTRTLGLGDLGKWIEATNASGLEVTVPPQSDVSWPLNAEIHGCGDTNAVTFVEGSGVTVKALSAIGPSMVWTLKRVDTDEWRLIPQSGGKVLIEEITLSSAGEFDFDNIPAGFNRLLLVGAVAGTGGGTNQNVDTYINNDTTTGNYYYQRSSAYNGSNQSTTANDNIIFPVVAAGGLEDASFVEVKIEDYTGTNLKSMTSLFSARLTTSALATGNFMLSSAVTAAVTRLRFKNTNSPTDGLTGTLRLYGEM